MHTLMVASQSWSQPACPYIGVTSRICEVFIKASVAHVIVSLLRALAGVHIRFENTMEFKNLKLCVRDGDGWIDVSTMCRSVGTRFKDYTRNKSTQQFLEILAEKKGEIFDKQMERGAWYYWACPEVVLDTARWIDPRIGVEMAFWIEEWRQTSESNYAKWMQAIESIEPITVVDPAERRVVEQIVASLGNIDIQLEVHVHGASDEYIDILTPTHLYEVKTWRKWKHGLGQVLAYLHAYEYKRQGVLALFDCIDDMMPLDARHKAIEICAKYDIDVQFWYDDFALNVPVALAHNA